jgi:hypothetical protein
VCAFLGNHAAFQYHDAVGAFDRARAVRDDDRRSTSQRFERLSKDMLTLSIERTRR